MRIISGIYGGLQLVSKIPRNIRPTTDISRESLFNVITNLIDFEGVRVLDLFAGTGALGIEAISRGAAFVQFVDKSAQSISLIKSNLQKFQINPQNYNIQQKDVLKFLSSEQNKFDLIFADPPYDLNVFSQIADILIQKKVLMDSGIFVYELRASMNIFIPNGLNLIKTKEFGETKFYFLKYP
jgi:putative methyltransferase